MEAYFVIVSTFFILLSSWSMLPYEYIILVMPVFFAFFTCALSSKVKKVLSKKLVSTLALLLIVSILLPIVTAYISGNQVLVHAASLKSDNEKVQVIGDIVQTLGTFNKYRSHGDFWKYLLVGTGACYEIAMASTTLLEASGFDARIVALPGEDHDFTEVKMNGTWMVIDPGYGYTAPISRQQRADARLTEMGAISYVIAYSGTNFTELTSFYVPTDTITIKVTNGSTRIVNAQVYLLHEFRSEIRRLPDTGATFFTNATGEVTFSLGALTYNENASKYDSYYWIYVNGKTTEHNVTSTGTDTTYLIEIDLANK
jgi:hypothetical protein